MPPTHLLFFLAGLALGALPASRALTVLIATLPLASFAAHTGALFIEEHDVLVIGVLLVWLFRANEKTLVFAGTGVWCLWLSAALVSALLGLTALPLSFDSFQLSSYHTPWNALRLLKPTLLATALVWLVRYQRIRPEEIEEALMQGLFIGLIGVVLVCFWEKAAFTGLTNFSTDYRITGPFWEMHVGGAALDGFLALSLPACGYFLYRAATPGAALLAALVFGAASYTVFITFSRGLYLAYAVILVTWALAGWRAHRHRRRAGLQIALALGLLVLVALMVWVFSKSGYRGLAALCALAAVSAYLASQPWPRLSARTALWVWGPMVAAFVLIGALEKAAYFAFAAICLAWLASAVVGAVAVSWQLAVGVAAGAVWVSYHWGGAEALPGALIAASCCLTTAFFIAPRARSGVPVIKASLRSALVAGITLMLTALLAVGAHSSYLGERMAGLSHDANGRWLHWQAGFLLWQNGSATERWLGVGLGRYPQLTGAHEGEQQGLLTHQFMRENGQTFLRLAGPSRAHRVDELLRIAQHRAGLPLRRVVLTVSARSEAAARLEVEACFKHLLYAFSCESVGLPIAPTAGEFREFVKALDLTHLKPGPPWAPRDAMIAFKLPSGVVDLTDLSLITEDGENIIDNGDFGQGPARWFFTSDHHHLPWHAKNLFLHLLIEQGIVGLAAFASLVLFCVVSWAQAASLARPHAAFWISGVLGFGVVGLIDSLLDAPRLALCAWLVMCLSSMRSHSSAAR
ncbi:MAG: hypothetical protein RIR70_1029 [Pseudomonadota bacterium]